MLVNSEIKFKEVLLITQDGKKLGKFSGKRANEIALENGLDLVCMNEKSQTPVCKMMDYKKFLYDQKKKEKENKRNSVQNEQHEIKFSYRIQDHDLEVKANTAKRLIEKGEVKLTLVLKGREESHADMALKTMEKLLEMTSEFSDIKKPASIDGRFITSIIQKKKEIKKA